MLFYFLLFLGFFLIFFFFHLISYYLFEFLYFKTFNLLSSDEKRSSQHEFTSTIAVIGIFICYTIGSLNLYTSIERRWTETDNASYLGIIITLGYTVYEEVLYLMYKKELIYHIHHLLACIITIYSCIYPKLHFFICWGGTVEITGIFVNLFLLSKRFKFSTTITNLYGFLMWISFVTFRFISLILMFLVIFLDSFYHSKYSIQLVALPYLIVCGVSAIILFSLSIYWLSKITTGLIKVLFPKAKQNQIHPLEVDEGGSEGQTKQQTQSRKSQHQLISISSSKKEFKSEERVVVVVENDGVEIGEENDKVIGNINIRSEYNNDNDIDNNNNNNLQNGLEFQEKLIYKSNGDSTHIQSGDLELGTSESVKGVHQLKN